MESKAKKLSTRICVGLFFFLGGIEYAVILPTLWLYVEHRFDAEQWFFGVIFSSFCFSSLFSSPFFGFWVDYTRTTKKAILFANLFEIGGNFLYFVAWSKYWVLAARLMAGIGAGVGSAIFAQIARTTTVEERTGMYSLAMGLRQFGLLLGPSFNLFLKELNVKLGPFLIDAYTSPGIFMAVTWLLLEIVIILFYHDWSLVEASSYKEEKSSSPRNAITSCESKEMSVDSQINPCVNVADEDLTVLSNGRTICQDSTWKLQDVNLPLRRLTLSSTAVKAKWNLAKDLMREEVMVILASQFILFFNETAFEALFTPLSEHLLGWKEVQNSIAYSLIALEAILVFFLVSKLSHRMSDRWLIVVGTAFEGFALIWYLCLLANAKPYEPVILPTIIVGTLVIVFGIPFFSVANVSLYSKITEERTQGIAQGVQRSTTGVAMILGPLWGGALIPSLYLMFGVMLAIEVIFAIMLFMSFDLLKESPRELPSQYDEISTHDENQPLLA